MALSTIEKQSVLDTLYSERFQDKTPYEAYATLLDDGVYYCSISTMYRFLNAEHGNVEDRRRQVKRPIYSKPELLATMPKQVWSWDITKLKGPVKWDLLLSVRYHGYFQSLCCRLDGCSSRKHCLG